MYTLMESELKGFPSSQT